jgi:hypothetical protein
MDASGQEDGGAEAAAAQPTEAPAAAIAAEDSPQAAATAAVPAADGKAHEDCHFFLTTGCTKVRGVRMCVTFGCSNLEAKAPALAWPGTGLLWPLLPIHSSGLPLLMWCHRRDGARRLA